MAKDIVTKAEILGGEIDVRANFGQTVKVTVSPDPYTGDTEVTPSAETQVLATKKKFVQDDITVLPAPVETLSTTENGQFTPSEGKVGFYQVDVNVVPDLRPLSVSENGTYQPDGFDGYSDVTVNTPVPSGSMEITDNGTYNVANKESVNVAVEGQWIDYDNIPVTLPVEYQRVEYIESSGTQFIELPIGFYPTDEVSIKGANPNINSSDKYLVSPKTWNNNDNRFAIFGSNRNTQNTLTYVFGYGNLGTGHTTYTMPVGPNNDFHRFYYADRISVCPDLAIAIGVANVVFGSETANLKLFYGYNANTIGKINYYIHKKVDGRKLALFACYRKSDGVIGMYDIENDVFYTNDGSGDFTKGQDI